MIDELHHQFGEAFESTATIGTRAPGRINLIGEHIDYLGGYVMPMAIERAIYALASPNQKEQIRIRTSLSDQVATLSTDEFQKKSGNDSWLNYILGVVAVYRQRRINCPGFDIAIDTDLPTGAGLSSSAALETTIALVVEKLAGESLDVKTRALLCQQAEHEYAGVPCGIMDQMAVGACTAGKAIQIDCQNQEVLSVEIPSGVSIIVSDTQVQHALGDGEYRKRREDCEAALHILPTDTWRDATQEIVEEKRTELGETLHRRARHAVTEISRVTEFAEAMKSLDRERMGELLHAGHHSLRDDFEVSCPELDLLVESAYALGPAQGVIGARMTGGGFGGSTITLVEENAAPKVIEELKKSFSETYDRSIEPFVTAPAAGASYLQI